MTIDTDTSPECQTIEGLDACVIAFQEILVRRGIAVTATGERPLALVATDRVTIGGTLDVSSHRDSSLVGAGGNPDCKPGSPPASGDGGSGGGFGDTGGPGGGGSGERTGPMPRTPGFHGGCRGQDGKEGSGSTADRRGLGGSGGGAIYVVAGGEMVIDVGATINASGAGGGGAPGPSAGGGGGGAGGLIVLDAPSILNEGVIFANGGGGGEGSGIVGGMSGQDPIGVRQALGGSGGDGGDGGNGGEAIDPDGESGKDANGSGGGGGGGVGVICTFPFQLLGGSVSPKQPAQAPITCP